MAASASSAFNSKTSQSSSLYGSIKTWVAFGTLEAARTSTVVQSSKEMQSANCLETYIKFKTSK